MGPDASDIEYELEHQRYVLRSQANQELYHLKLEQQDLESKAEKLLSELEDRKYRLKRDPETRRELERQHENLESEIEELAAHIKALNQLVHSNSSEFDEFLRQLGMHGRTLKFLAPD